MSLAPLLLCSRLWLAWAIVWALAASRTERTERAEPRARRLEHTLATVAALALLLLPPRLLGPLSRPWLEPPAARWAGAGLTAAGLLFACWARWHIGRYWSGTITLKRGHRLIRTGPYGLTRHPIYTGFLAAILGTALAGGCLAGLLAVAIAVPTYLRKLRREEALMIERFGAEYDAYRREVPALIPCGRLRRAPS